MGQDTGAPDPCDCIGELYELRTYFNFLYNNASSE